MQAMAKTLASPINKGEECYFMKRREKIRRDYFEGKTFEELEFRVRMISHWLSCGWGGRWWISWRRCSIHLFPLGSITDNSFGVHNWQFCCNWHWVVLLWDPWNQVLESQCHRNELWIREKENRWSFLETAYIQGSWPEQCHYFVVVTL